MIYRFDYLRNFHKGLESISFFHFPIELHSLPNLIPLYGVNEPHKTDLIVYKVIFAHYIIVKNKVGLK